MCLSLLSSHTTVRSRIVATVSDWIDSSQFRSAPSAFSSAAVSICRALLLPFPLLQGNYLSLQQNNLFIESIVPLFEFLHGDGIGHARLQQLILFIPSPKQWMGYWIGIGHPLAFIEKDGFLFTVVQRLGFVAAIPALIFGILRDVTDGACVKGIALQAGIAAAGQFL